MMKMDGGLCGAVFFGGVHFRGRGLLNLLVTGEGGVSRIAICCCDRINSSY